MAPDMLDNIPTLCSVLWDDANSAGIESMSISDIDSLHVACPMETVGWVLKQDAAGISIANERYLEENTYRGHTFIPHSMITKITPLTKKRVPSVKKGPATPHG